jgi:hypothetical protein
LGKRNGSTSSSGTGNYPFYGKLSNIKFYSVALEASEVQKLYRLGRTGRSMVISDTAVGIGKIPEAQLDVRGAISCDAIHTGMIAQFVPNLISFGSGATTTMTWKQFDSTLTKHSGDYGLFRMVTGDAEFNLPYKGVYQVIMKLNSQISGLSGTLQILCEYLNSAENGWSTWNNSEMYEPNWSGAHEVHFTFTMDTRVGYRWRFRMSNNLNATFTTLSTGEWSRMTIFKIA